MNAILGTGNQPRGLHNFISEIRNCANKDEERMRVDKELANIRSHFTQSNLTPYQKKKYVWKMCYIYMLGYEVDFGHMEFISLLSSTKFQEKSVGYMAVALLIKHDDSMMTLVVNSVRNDVLGSNLGGITLALSAVANIGGKDFAETLSLDIQRLINHPMDSRMMLERNPDGPSDATKRSIVMKKALLALNTLYRCNSDCVDVSSWDSQMNSILEDRDLGIVTSGMSLLLGFTAVNASQFEACVTYVISVLTRLVVSKSCTPDYLYYRIPSPWLQVKCLRFLQYYKAPTDKNELELLNDVLRKILAKGEVSTDSVNKNNAEHCVVFEAIALIISYGTEADAEMKEMAQTLLGRFIAGNDANAKYLALEALSRVARLDGSASVHAHRDTVMNTLKDSDNSVRKRALDLLFVMADKSNSTAIIQELLIHLTMAEAETKEELVVKIAIIAEKYSSDLNWYIDTMIQVILAAGDFVAEDVWFRIIQIITNNPEIQEYACEKLLSAVKSKFAHETAICLAGYVLGEFGLGICEKPDMGGYEQFAALQQHFPNVTTRTKAILLTCYVKLMNLYPVLKDMICAVFTKLSSSQQLELQQRSCEYLQMPLISAAVMEAVLDSMPLYNKEVSSLERKMKESEDTSTRIIAKAERTEKPAAAAGSSSSSSSSSNTSSSPAKAAAAVDLLSLDDDAGPSPADPFGTSSFGAGGAATSYDAALAPKVTQWFNACTMLNGNTAGQKAVLFEDDKLKVTVYPLFHQHQARIGVLFTNTSNAEITGFSCDVKVAEGTAAEALVIQKQEPPTRLMPIEDGKMQLAVACMRPFAESPTMAVKFTVGGKAFCYNLRVPLYTAHFFDPIVLNKEVFMTRWKALEGEGRESQEVFTSVVKPMTPGVIAQIRSKVFSAMHIGLAEGVDTDVTITGCATFRTGTMGPDGQTPVVVGCMVRVEADVNGGRFRVTVRSAQPTVAAGMKACVKSHIGTTA